MKKVNSDYFAMAKEVANQEFHGMDGFGAQDLPFGGGDLPADGGFGYNNEHANAAGGSRPHVSQPYEIIIENTTTADISNVTILDAALTAPNNFAVPGVSFTYGSSNVTYGQFLSTLLSRAFSVGQLRLSAANASASTATSQVLTSVEVTTNDLTGNLVQQKFTPQLNSFQQITNQTDLFYDFMVDQLTKIVFGTLFASTTLTIYLYPSERTNPFNELRGQGNVTRYRDPRINQIPR